MELAYIETVAIKPPKYLLRPVRKESSGYITMLDSIRDNGLWQPILVRPLDNGLYELVDGNYRFHCCKELRFTTIPCIIRDLTDTEVLLAQLQANGIRPETSPVEFAERLYYMLNNTPDMTVPRLAKLIRMTPAWIRKILKLRTSDEPLSTMIRRGEISVTAACALVCLPKASRDALLKQAQILPARELVKLARQELKRIRENGRDRYIDGHRINQDKPVPHLRKIPEIKYEFKRPTAAGPVLVRCKAKSPMDGWNACLAWILHMDIASLVIQEEMIQERMKQQERAIERRRKERAALREARQKANDASLLVNDDLFTSLPNTGE